jgi:hypothetical protein
LALGGCDQSADPFNPLDPLDPLDPLVSCVEVQGTFNPAAPGVIVMYKGGTDPVATTRRLETKYEFSANYVYTSLGGFAAELSNAALLGVRCEPAVATVSYDAVGSIATP